MLVETPHNLRLKLIICLALGLVTLTVFWQIKDFQFVDMDDSIYITANSQVQTGLT